MILTILPNCTKLTIYTITKDFALNVEIINIQNINYLIIYPIFYGKKELNKDSLNNAYASETT